MKKAVKGTIAATLSATMLLSSACSFLDKSKDEVLEAADAYCKAVVDRSSKNVPKLSTELDDDVAELLPMLFDMSYFSYDEEVQAVMTAIADSISYEIDEDSVDASKKEEEGEVDAVFTIVDYDSVFDNEENMVDLDTCLAALEDAETTEITITIEFALEDDEWLVSNTDDVISTLYDFIDADVEFPDPVPDLTEYVSGGYWYYTSNGDQDDPVYENANEIDLDLEFSVYPDDYSGVYYTVEYNGTVVYTSSTYSRMGYFYSTDTGAPVDANGNLSAGTYTITFYDANNNDMLLYSDSCTVTTVAETTTTTASSVDDDECLPGDVYWLTDAGDAFYDGTGEGFWCDPDTDETISDGVYPSGTTTILFSFASISYSDAASAELYYSASCNIDDAQQVSSADATINQYSNGSFYDIEFTVSGSGYYYIMVYDANDNAQILSCCEVQ